ncbi:MAG: hypothetical protein AMXMBFR7_08260 [Planctomycetota bacterium]
MRQRERSVSRVLFRGALAATLALAALSGCGDKKHAKAPAPATERMASAPSVTPSMPQPEPRTPPPAPTGAVRWSDSITLYGPMPQAELDKLINAPAITNVGIARPASTASAGPAPAHIAAADPRWDVRLGTDWNYLVLHHSASATGSAASFHRAHLARGWDGLGYHFVIGNGSGSGDGEVEIGYRWQQQTRGAHAGNAEYNEHGIGICLVGNFEETHPTPRQMQALTTLVRFLQAKCGIPANKIVGHSDVPGKDTQCPGRYFSMSSFRGQVGSAGSGPVSVSAAKPAKKSATSSVSSGIKTSALLP